MKYYVCTSAPVELRNKMQNVAIVHGDYVKGKRAIVYIEDYEFEETNEFMIEKLYNNPIKTLRAATRLKNKYSKSFPNLVAKVREFPDEISYDQFKAFIRWY